MPSENRSSRRLAAILFADVVGYTSLMQKDESAATTQLRRFQSTITDEVQNHAGEIGNFYGDGALCIFNSPIEAMRCAIALQTSFGKDEKVPVRVGIHSGTVIQEGEKVFGDSVNIAARIESMGIPGSILVSKRVRDELKNHPDILLPSLGSFDFKNVEESMEVFALANEGFMIPKKGDIQGKFKEKQTSSPSLMKYLIPLAAIVVVGLGIWTWQSGSRGSMALLGGNTLEPVNTPLSQDVREKRIAVMVFDNQTSDANLQSLGLMANDWITKGLMEVNKGKVVNAANVRNNIALAGTGGGANPDFANAIGADVLITGRYYLTENEISIYSNIVDAHTRDVIYALDAIQGDRNKPLDLIDELSQRIVGYWATAETEKYNSKPPKYEAYQLFLQADEHWTINDSIAEIKLNMAYATDSSYYEALLKLCVLYKNNRRLNEIGPMLDFIKSKNPTLSKYEQLRLNAIAADYSGDIDVRAEAYEQLTEFDPESSYMAGFTNVLRNRPSRALPYLRKEVDRDRGKMNTSWSQRVEFKYLEALNMLDKHLEIIEFVDSLNFEIKEVRLAGFYISSLVRLGKTQEALEKFEHYSKKDFGVEQAVLYNLTCIAMHNTENEFMEEFVALGLIEANKMPRGFDRQYSLVILSYMINNYNNILSYYDDQISDGHLKGYYLVATDLSGSPERAEQMYNQWISDIEDDFIDPSVFYGQALYFTALGNKEKAFDYIEKAFYGGFGFDWFRYQYDPALKGLWDYPPFQELVKPKG